MSVRDTIWIDADAGYAGGMGEADMLGSGAIGVGFLISSIPLLGWGVAAVFLVVAVLLYLRSRREWRRSGELMARLDALESRLAVSSPAAGATDRPPAAPGPKPGDILPASGDVLAGLTTHVQRILDLPAAETRTLPDQAIAVVHRHLEDPFTPHELAHELHVSLRTLERGLALTMDCTPRQLITAVKMREARRLLLAGRLQVKEVAYRLGFADQYHFSRSFKAFFHVPPSGARDGVRTQQGSARLP